MRDILAVENFEQAQAQIQRKRTKDKIESEESDGADSDSESMEEDELNEGYGEEHDGINRIEHKYNLDQLEKGLEGGEDISDDEEDRFYSDEEDGSSSPVSKPSDLKGLLKHKQKKSLFDPKIYELINNSDRKPGE